MQAVAVARAHGAGQVPDIPPPQTSDFSMRIELIRLRAARPFASRDITRCTGAPERRESVWRAAAAAARPGCRRYEPSTGRHDFN